MFSFYLRKLIISPMMIFSIGGMFIMMLLSVCFVEGYHELSPLYLFQYSNAVGISYYFIPVMTVLPICFLQYEIITKDAEKFLLYRSTALRYLTGGLFASGIAGAVMMLASFGIFILFCVLTSADGVSLSTGLHNFTGTWLENCPAFAVYLWEAFVFSMNGIIWPVISFVSFLFSKNQYIAASIPLILRSGSSYLLQRLEWYYLDPAQLQLDGVVSSGQPDGGLFYLILYIAVVVSICGIISFVKLRRRIIYG